MPAELPGELYVAEPAGRFAVRSPLVADCSVLAALLFYEPSRDRAAEILSGKALNAPDLVDHEIANVAVKKSQQGLGDVVQQALSELARMELTRCRTDTAGQCALALEHGLTAYDAAYLWLAAELKAPLATFDRRLANAAREHLRGQ